MTIILAILFLGLLILAHELGHFMVAKYVGIEVYEFAIGLGPSIASTKKGETKYSLRCLPIGGYNKMAGMEPGDEDNEKGFGKKSVAQRIAVISAGSLMNFLLAIILFIFVFAIVGVPSNSNVIGEISPDSPAESAGLEPGDKIVAIEDKEIASWNDLVSIIHENPREQLTIRVVRDGDPFAVSVTPEFDPERDVGLIGIMQSIERKGFLSSIYLGFSNAIKVVVAIFAGFAKMISGDVPAEVAGPVGIVTIFDNVARFGIGNILNFVAVLSLNLGILNLLPIPALDGSRLVFLGIEGLRGKPIAPHKENLVHIIGFALLITLMIVITYQDILRIFD